MPSGEPCPGDPRPSHTFAEIGLSGTNMTMNWISICSPIAFLLLTPMAWSADESKTWKPGQAAKYLDEREKVWFEYAPANRGEVMTQSTCVSCHSVLPYAMGRPALRKLIAGDMATEFEKKLLAQTKSRVENWKKLDTPSFGVMYDFNEQKKKESWG